MKPVLALDVDLTLVDSLTPWLNWIRGVTKNSFIFELGSEYNRDWVEGYHQMPEYFMKNGYSGPMGLEELTHEMMAYWRQPDLYLSMVPIPGAYRAFRELSLTHEIVFVSHCINEHTESKKDFLKTYFGNNPFIDTSAKQFVDYDVIVDDTPSVIDRCMARNPDRLHITYQGVFFNVFGKETSPGNFGFSTEDRQAVHRSHLPGHNVTFSWAETLMLIKTKGGQRHLSKTERDMFRLMNSEERTPENVAL